MTVVHFGDAVGEGGDSVVVGDDDKGFVMGGCERF